MTDRDTIAAIATPAGAGGVGIVRLSGPSARAIGRRIAAVNLAPRRATHARFRDADGATLDDGIAIYFAAPASYTGEDVVELQAHGSPAVLQALVDRCCALGARRARPGEFSERAFLEGKLDLAQAEAVADLIAASDVRAARAARRALEGEFSRRVEAIADATLRARIHVEAAIDFADEPIETLGGPKLQADLAATAAALDALLRDGLHAVIVGPPNAGKSSLLNALAGRDRAIVTDVAGTTRDLLHEAVRIDGIELTLVDTAGLREGGDAIEREGMRRAHAELERADLAIVVLDACDPTAGRDAVVLAAHGAPAQLWLLNKSDLLQEAGGQPPGDVPGDAGAPEGAFTARARHVEALRHAAEALVQARGELARESLDLAAEALRQSHDALGEITGRVRADDLLGHIFSSFCIGK